MAAGSGVILTCNYLVTEGQAVDSIKWYYNTSEIYRLVPGLHHHRFILWCYPRDR